ncbi:MAG: MBL fold metallo-hydrolase [Acidobacteria bacterium]|nr:MBL fold metallo-hydrolase [Acidobacteriota bacterium]
MRLGFHGAARTVTGSRYLLSADNDRLLVDCGAFQGLKELRLRNWNPPPFEPWRVDWVVLTHAHIDHVGYLPRLVREGFRGPVYCTPPTHDLLSLMLMDAAHLHEEEAEYRNWKGTTKHRPAKPFFETEDVVRTMRLVQSHPYGTVKELSRHLSFRFADVGHLLGSAMIELHAEDAGRKLDILFSGDVGRYDVPLYPDPGPPPQCDVLLVESTYGDRSHSPEDLFDQIEALARRAFERGGVLLVPAFAVGRAQQVIYILRTLMERKRLPELKIHIDSPMAVDATKLYSQYPAEHRQDDPTPGGEPSKLTGPYVVLHRTREESKQLNSFEGPGVVISASGMLTGGRVLHHLRHYAPDPRHVIMLAGYQAAGTRGRALADGAGTLKLHGISVPVRATIGTVHGLSGHADAGELMKWLEPLRGKSRRAFVVHGEPHSADTFAKRLHDELGWDARAPQLDEVVEL